MKQKILLGVLALVFFVGIIILLRNRSQTKTASPTVSDNFPSSAPTVRTETGFKDYTDPAGFKFSYPAEITVAAKNISDDTVYSQLDIKSQEASGSISLKAVASSLAKIDDYFASKKTSSFFGGVKKLKLADIDARQYQINNQLITVALDQGVMFTITTEYPTDKKDYWKKINDGIISSFAFVEPTVNTSAAGGSSSDESGDVVFEGEEIVE
ncbi:hypothetical protein GYA28_00995 [Candidatus Roizmanbacteria bacterium]|jgi:hypothetical protein|nr:hypothetical protein [Candidatus Roizmanbacteria bacterium]